jgi:hypothetical protein
MYMTPDEQETVELEMDEVVWGGHDTSVFYDVIRIIQQRYYMI